MSIAFHFTTNFMHFWRNSIEFSIRFRINPGKCSSRTLKLNIWWSLLLVFSMVGIFNDNQSIAIISLHSKIPFQPLQSLTNTVKCIRRLLLFFSISLCLVAQLHLNIWLKGKAFNLRVLTIIYLFVLGSLPWNHSDMRGEIQKCAFTTIFCTRFASSFFSFSFSNSSHLSRENHHIVYVCLSI